METEISCTHKPVILIDVDGVINMLGRNESEAKSLWEDAATVFVRKSVKFEPFEILFSPSMVRKINEWNQVAEVRWLTSWNNLARTKLAPLLGLGDFPVSRDRRVLDKTAAAVANAEQLPPGTLLIWIDDELKKWKERHAETIEFVKTGTLSTLQENAVSKDSGIFDRPNTVLVSPCNGLTEAYCLMIDALLKDPESVRDEVFCAFECGIRPILM
jgi:hypothetical protein